MHLAALLLLGLIQTALPAKILILPSNVRSHILYMGRLGEELSLRGHDITLLLPSNNIQPLLQRKDSVEIMTYSTVKNISFIETREMGEIFIGIALAESLVGKLKAFARLRNIMLREMEVECASRFRSLTYEKIKARGYDFAIVDEIELYCGFSYPYSLDIPYAAMGVPLSAISWYRVPALPSFVPAKAPAFSDKMTFLQRLINFISECGNMIIMHRSGTEFVEKFVPHKVALTPLQLYSRSALLLDMQEPSFHYPSPTMPNIVRIGDIMVRPASPLTGSLKDFLDGAESGAMLVSLGSYFNFVPQVIVEKFCTAFSRLNIRIIWKIDTALTKSCDLDDTRIKVMSWIPQNDLLAHINVKVFLTHGGLNSIMESIYHGKVMLVMPIAVDQPYNANIVQNKKIGIAMSLSKFQVNDLIQNIEKLLSEDSYTNNMQVVSEILKDKPLQSGGAASFWINHVIKYGDGHLRSGAFELNVFQFLMMDIFLFIFVCFVIVISLLYLVCLKTIRYLKQECQTESKIKLN